VRIGYMCSSLIRPYIMFKVVKMLIFRLGTSMLCISADRVLA